MNRILVVGAILAFCTPCTGQESGVENLLAQAEPAIQGQLNQVLETFETQTSGDFGSNVVVFQEIQKLKESTADKGEIAKQIAIFVATPGLDERQRLMAPVVLQLLQLQPKIVIRALAPHLDSENEHVRSFVRDWFQGHDVCAEGPSTLLALNYADYLDYVRGQLNRNEEVPTAFIKYIYERSPERALIVFNYANPILHAETVARLLEMQKKFKADWQKREKAELDKRFPLKMMSEQEINELQKRVDRQTNKLTLEERKQQWREVHLAEHLVSHAIWLKENDYEVRFYKTALPEANEQLENLSKHDGWWDRLYVAEIMRQHRELRQIEVLEKLNQDSNALVSKSAKAASR